MNRSTRYSPEIRERAVRLVFEHQEEHESQWAAIGSIASKIGCTPETLRKWVRRAERDQGKCGGPSSTDRDRLKELTGTPQRPGMCRVWPSIIEASRRRMGVQGEAKS